MLHPAANTDRFRSVEYGDKDLQRMVARSYSLLESKVRSVAKIEPADRSKLKHFHESCASNLKQ
jgi:hypothetical protein